MADGIGNNDVKEMLERLREQTEGSAEDKTEYKDQVAHNADISADDLKSLLKKQFSADDSSDGVGASESSDYSFDFEEFTADAEDDSEYAYEIAEEGNADTAADELQISEDVEDAEDEMDAILDEITAETERELEADMLGEEIADEVEEEETFEPETEEIADELVEEEIFEPETEEITDELQAEEVFEPEIEETADETQAEEIFKPESEEASDDIQDEEVVETEKAEDEAIEVEADSSEADVRAAIDKFNNDLSDFDALLDGDIFAEEQSELVDEQGEQLQIFENPDEFTADTEAEESKPEPTDAAAEGSEFFTSDEDLDAIDIALMMALGGEDELNQTIGFEKIRQVVNEYDEKKESEPAQPDVYGYCGEEFTDRAKAPEIKEKYRSQRFGIIIRLLGTALLFMVLLAYESMSWVGIEMFPLFSKSENAVIHILAALQLAFFCAAISWKKIIKCFKGNFDASTSTCFAATVLLAVNAVNDVYLLAFGGSAALYHSAAALLFTVSACYDLFAISRQKGTFDIVSADGSKFVLEPYGRIKINDDGEESEDNGVIMDRDSYFATKTPFVERYFARTAEGRPQSVSQATSMILGFALALVVMLVLVLLNKPIDTVISGFVFTVCFSVISGTVLESEFALFVAYRRLKRIKSGIIGGSSAIEYGDCDLIYFDDSDVFDKRSVKTKGLKLYDNNEIYRVLYHTQAVFSKVGGPLRAVFEYATSEMAHSRSVSIKDVTGEGIIALVDEKTYTLIGSGAFMKSQGLSPKYTSSDLKIEEEGDESVMFIALNGVICAKLYVSYRLSRHFEALMKKLNSRGVGVGIRSTDPNVNYRWANKLAKYKKWRISVAKPSVKELGAKKKSSDSGVVSAKSSRSAIEALLTCLKLCELERVISRLRIASVAVGAVLALILLLFAGANTVSLLVMSLYAAICGSASMLMSYIYTKF